jgi:anti-sigma B factor antagonist
LRGEYVLSMSVQRRDGLTVVLVDEELDMRTAPELRERLNATLDDADGERLVLDLSGVPFLDSTTLSVLVGVHKRLRHRGHPLRIACPSDSVRRVLTVTGLARVFEVHDTLDAALA